MPVIEIAVAEKILSKYWTGKRLQNTNYYIYTTTEYYNKLDGFTSSLRFIIASNVGKKETSDQKKNV